MQIKADSVAAYLKQVPEARRKYFIKLRETILDNLPPGFVEEINYGMIGYVVPHSIYPAGYHCNPKLPLPFVNIASQKHFIAFYHLGLYAKKDLLNWFVEQYHKQSKQKLDMGKSCVRFKKMEDIPYKLIGQTMKKISVKQWIAFYDSSLANRKK